MQTAPRSGIASLLWAAALRAEIAHLALFVLLPLLNVLIHLMLGIVLLPFLLLGAGDRGMDPAAPKSHLGDPGCWIVLAPCVAADRTLFSLGATVPTPAPDPAVEPTQPTPPSGVEPMRITLRHIWFLIRFAWFLEYLLHLERLKSPP
jgi:hypothetical protein